MPRVLAQKISAYRGDITVRCPRYNRDTEGGKTFLVTAAKLWNSLPTREDKLSSLATY